MSEVFSFGYWVRRRRKALDLTQRELAQRVGCAAISIRKIEADEFRPSRQIAERLADMLELLADERAAFLHAARAELRTDRLHDPVQDVTLPHPPEQVQQIQASLPSQPAAGHWHDRRPPPPRLLVGRDRDLQQMKARLVPARAQSMAPVQVLTAIRGWPGVGKTTLATALAHDHEIAVAFPDGVLWASLGETPNLFAELLAWGHALGAGDLAHAQELDTVSTVLTALLHEKRMLLIVDDAWNIEHVLPFRVGGPGCVLLITTRLPEVAHALASTPYHIYNLPVLSEHEAFRLLETLAPTVVAEHPEASRELVRDLECLPLAVHVAGGLLNTEAEYGLDVQGLIAELRAGVKVLAAQAPVEYADLTKETTPTVAILLHKSTDCLDPNTRDCFALLGMFAPKPATFDVDALQAVWEVADPKPIIRSLVDRGLLEPVSGARFQMHALLVSHARSLLST